MVWQEDKKALMEGRPATHKLRQLDKVMSSLRNKQLQHHLVDKYKLLALIAQWLKPLPGQPRVDYLTPSLTQYHASSDLCAHSCAPAWYCHGP
jgi:hypothetical protein